MSSTRAVVYCRISQDRSGKEAGVDRQLTQCRQLAEARGWQIVDTYTDNDLSAYSGKRRPAYERLLDDMKGGGIDVLIAWHPDRLYRHMGDLERFVEVVDVAGVEVATVRAGDIDLGTATGKLVARLVGATAVYESEHKAERLRSKQAELAVQGRWAGGIEPYGYRSAGQGTGTLVILEEEAAIVREGARRALAGETLFGIANDLNRRGVPRQKGGTWRQSTLKRMLTAPATAGLREHAGTVVGQATWPGIISRADQERLIAVLTDPARAGHRPARNYLLTGGLVVCGRCGTALTGHARPSGARLYQCAGSDGRSGCNKLVCVAEPLETLVVEMVLVALDGPALAKAMSSAGDEPDPAAEELADVERRLLEVADMYAAGEIDRAGSLRARAGLEARQRAARAGLRKRSNRAALEPYRDGGLREAWAALSLDQRRAVLSAVIDRAVVAPALRRGRNFDPDRVGIIWKV